MNSADRLGRDSLRRGAKLVGNPTRGTTNPNRLRRVDRWLTTSSTINRPLKSTVDPLVVDLGYGASPVTTVEMAKRLRVSYPDIRVLGLELDSERVAVAQHAAEPPFLEFRRGGFELAGSKPVLVRAFNVLRQYSEEEVRAAWRLILNQMPPGGILVEGTCDEIGRLCSWVTVNHDGPQTLTLSAKLSTLARPSTLAERLPKILIHHNIPGEKIFNFLSTLDSCWDSAAPQQIFGARSRWMHTVQGALDRGWPILREPKRWRLGEATINFEDIAPNPLSMDLK